MSSSIKPTSGYLGAPPSTKTSKFMVIDGEAQEIHSVVVHRFKVSDVDDPGVYAAPMLWEWEHSEAGKWVNEHAIETPQWHSHTDHMSWHTHFTITAKLKDKDHTLWVLKYK